MFYIGFAVGLIKIEHWVEFSEAPATQGSDYTFVFRVEDGLRKNFSFP